ncbi:MAG: hypothetical protein ACT4OY_05295 [Alphaproteobacteria bacterium]
MLHLLEKIQKDQRDEGGELNTPDLTYLFSNLRYLVEHDRLNVLEQFLENIYQGEQSAEEKSGAKTALEIILLHILAYSGQKNTLPALVSKFVQKKKYKLALALVAANDSGAILLAGKNKNIEAVNLYLDAINISTLGDNFKFIEIVGKNNFVLLSEARQAENEAFIQRCVDLAFAYPVVTHIVQMHNPHHYEKLTSSQTLALLNGFEKRLSKEDGNDFASQALSHNRLFFQILSGLEQDQDIEKLIQIAYTAMGNSFYKFLEENIGNLAQISGVQGFSTVKQIAVSLKEQNAQFAGDFLKLFVSEYLVIHDLQTEGNFQKIISFYFDFLNAQNSEEQYKLLAELIIKSGSSNHTATSYLIPNIHYITQNYHDLIKHIVSLADEKFLGRILGSGHEIAKRFTSEIYALRGQDFVGDLLVNHLVRDTRDSQLLRSFNEQTGWAFAFNVKNYTDHQVAIDAFKGAFERSIKGDIESFRGLIPFLKDVKDADLRKALMNDLYEYVDREYLSEEYFNQHGDYRSSAIIDTYIEILDVIQHWNDKEAMLGLMNGGGLDYVLTWSLYDDCYKDQVNAVRKAIQVVNFLNDVSLKKRFLTIDYSDSETYLENALINGTKKDVADLLQMAKEVASNFPFDSTEDKQSFIHDFFQKHVCHDFPPLTEAIKKDMQDIVQRMLLLAYEDGNEDLVLDLMSDRFKKNYNYIAFSTAIGAGNTQIMGDLITWVEKLGGKELVLAMIKAQAQNAEYIFTKNTTQESMQKFFDLAEAYGGPELISEIISYNDSKISFLEFKHVSESHEAIKVLRKFVYNQNDPIQALEFEKLYPIPDDEVISFIDEQVNNERSIEAFEKATQVNFENILSYKSKALRDLIRKDDYKLIEEAMQNLDRASFKALLQSLHKTCGSKFLSEMFSNNNYALVDKAANINRFDILNSVLISLKKIHILEDALSYNDYKLFRDSIKNNESAELLIILSHVPKSLFEEAEKILPENLAHLLGHPKHEIWQKEGAGNERWIVMTGQNAPEGVPPYQSPLGYNAKFYKQTLSLLQLAADIEGKDDKNLALYAYRLACIFSNINEIERYLDKNFVSFIHRVQRDRDEDVNEFVLKQSHLFYDRITSASNFELPVHGIWTPHKWKNFLLRNGENSQSLSFIKNAPVIESYIQKNHLQFPKSVKKMAEYAALALYENAEKGNENQDTYDLNRLSENPTFTELAFKYELSPKYFSMGLDVLKAAKTKDYLPEIFIDGAYLGQPDYYMEKLQPGDPIGLFLGKLTDCCQSIDWEREDTGKKCAIHGTVSEYSGFYVWKKKTDGQITDSDPIIAQSWAWLSKHNQIIFDSFEISKEERPKLKNLSQPFLEQFAYQIIGNHTYPEKTNEGLLSHRNLTVNGIRLGRAITAPNEEGQRFWVYSLDMELLKNEALIKEMIEPCEYNDSDYQYIVNPKEHYRSQQNLLSASNDYSEAEILAQSYISSALERFKDQYGIELKASIELECYALDDKGLNNQNLIDVKFVEEMLKSLHLAEVFEEENPGDKKGQYEAKTIIADPLTIARKATEVREYLEAHAQDFGAAKFDFQALPFSGEEASSTHISISLWSEDGQPLMLDKDKKDSALMKAVAKGSLEVQKEAVLLYAQEDNDYLRFDNTKWSPKMIGLANNGEMGTSLRFADKNNYAYRTDDKDPASVRMEDRLASANVNIFLAMAARIAGIDYALQRYVKVLGTAGNSLIDYVIAGEKNFDIVNTTDQMLLIETDELDNFLGADLPQNRYEALELFQKSSEEGGLLEQIFGRDFCDAVLRQQLGEEPRNEQNNEYEDLEIIQMVENNNDSYNRDFN